MRVLVSNHWLKKLGGSETFTYALSGELVRKGHDVDIFTNVPGMVSNGIVTDFGVGTKLRDSYDLILANHHTTVDSIHGLGPVIQTCHGTIPKLERPSAKATKTVAISKEIAKHIGADHIIWNGIDCGRFRPKKQLNVRPKNILSLVHSDEANRIIHKACRDMNIGFMSINKYKKQIWEVEERINRADLVISLGRGAYESMACGRPVIVFDSRPYQKMLGDGYVDSSNIHDIMENNCSGRKYKKEFTVEKMKSEIMKYKKSDGEFLREFAFGNLNIEKQVDKYFDIFNNDI